MCLFLFLSFSLIKEQSISEDEKCLSLGLATLSNNLNFSKMSMSVCVCDRVNVVEFRAVQIIV